MVLGVVVTLNFENVAFLYSNRVGALSHLADSLPGLSVKIQLSALSTIDGLRGAFQVSVNIELDSSTTIVQMTSYSICQLQ